MARTGAKDVTDREATCGRPVGRAADLRQSRSFVLRFWVEPRDASDEAGIVRGRVVEVGSGAEHYFPSPEAALDYLGRAVGTLSSAGSSLLPTETECSDAAVPSPHPWERGKVRARRSRAAGRAANREPKSSDRHHGGGNEQR